MVIHHLLDVSNRASRITDGSILNSETSKRHLKRQQPKSDAKSDANFAAIMQFLTCHFMVVTGRCISRSLHDSAKVVISRLLTRNCCSLAVVVSATFASLDGQVEKSSFHGRCHLGPRWVELGHSKVVVSWLL